MTPDEFTNQEFFLDVGDGHRLYVHDWGKSDAKMPIVFLHGGPGNGCDDKDKAKFDPKTQRVLFHDQRGSGKSTPSASLEHNTTADLIKDINKIVAYLELQKFVLNGGSWGSTLSLAYAIDNPEKVAGMVIDGVFTAGQAETEWFERGGWKEFFPDAWEEFQSSVPTDYRDNPSAYHLKRATSSNPEAAKKSAYAYIRMELSILKLDSRYQPKPYKDFQLSDGLIEMHYLANGCFMPKDHILNQASKLTMPVYIIQGRYDMVCPPVTAYSLSKVLPDARLIWTINGHLKQHEAGNVMKLLLDSLTGDL